MNRTSTVKMTLCAFCVAVNFAGAALALALRLPIYLDSVGTIFCSVLLGPWFGMAAACLSNTISGITSDVYAFYFIPAGMVTGCLAGILSRSGWFRKKRFLWGVLFLTVPGTIVSSCIAAFVFGGVTSSGSSILVQILNHAGLPMVASTFLVQILTDFLDRLISVFLVEFALSRFGNRIEGLLGKDKPDDGKV